ncbi:MAG: peptidoglycan editing factor PgeF [bacterium]|nr:peptidoglycan editing factor PgeF [bacterium]
MILKTEAETSYYQFENLAACRAIDHRIYTRHGGFSRPPYAGLNVTVGIGDEEDAVIRNRNIIARSMETKKLVFTRQIHGNQVAVLGPENRGPGNYPAGESGTADALVTNVSQKYLVIQVADCQPVLMYDTNRQVAANVHSGWRGSITNIIGRTVKAMQQHFDCNPEDIQAGIGPSLGPCCAEFINYKDEIPQAYWQYKDPDHHFDFWSISRDQLIGAGVPVKNIEISRICTRCRKQDFFSYRAEKTTGRFAAVIGIKEMSNDE